MARKYYWPGTLPEQYALMQNVRGKIAGHQAALGLTDEQVEIIIAICETFIAVYNYVESVKETAGSLAEWRDDIFYSTKNNDPIPAPATFATFTAPEGSFVGIVVRFKAMRDLIVNLPGYTEAIGDDLNFIGSEIQPRPPADEQPTIKVTPASTGYVASIVVSGRAKSDSWEVWILNKGSESWVKIDKFTGKSVDITFTPTTDGEPYQFQIRVQLIKNNANYGQPSQAATVTVTP